MGGRLTDDRKVDGGVSSVVGEGRGGRQGGRGVRNGGREGGESRKGGGEGRSHGGELGEL